MPPASSPAAKKQKIDAAAEAGEPSGPPAFIADLIKKLDAKKSTTGGGFPEKFETAIKKGPVKYIGAGEWGRHHVWLTVVRR